MNVLARYLPIIENVHQYVCNAFFHWHRPLQCRHNERDGVSNHQPDDCLLNLLFRLRSKKTQKLRVTINGQLRGKWFHLMTSSRTAHVIQDNT